MATIVGPLVLTRAAAPGTAADARRTDVRACPDVDPFAGQGVRAHSPSRHTVEPP
ncbi:hypothetical protein ACWD2L_10560 [Streptomyces sp. NPDC002754]